MVNGFPMTSSDQICKIFSLLGTPNKEDMSFVTDKKALDYITSFDHLPRVDLKDKFAGIPDEGIDFLDRLLQFNPYFRMTLDQAIDHPFFADIREESKYKNKVLKKPKTLQQPEFEANSQDLTLEQLRKLFIKELMHSNV